MKKPSSFQHTCGAHRAGSDFDINSEDFDTLVSEHINNCDDSDVFDDQSASLDVIDVGPWELGMW